MNTQTRLQTVVSPQPGFGPGQGGATDDDFIDLGRLLHAVLRYKWGILGLAFAMTLITGLWVYTLEPVYRASASVVLESQESNVVNVEKVYSMGYRDYDYYQTQFEILRSRHLAERVVRKLQLHKHPFFAADEEDAQESGFGSSLTSLLPAREQAPPVQLTAAEKEEQAIQGVTGYVAGGLDVQPVDYSYLAYLSFESTDPKLAATIVNAVAQEFIDADLEVRLSGTLQATDWLSSRMDDLKRKLHESEQALQAFRESEGLVEVEGETSLGSNELRSLAQRLEEARKARIEAQNIKEDVQGMSNASTEELMTVPAVLQHQVIRDIKKDQSAAERKVAELGKRYGPKHPKMIAARSDLAAANSDLAREVRKVVSGINREYEVALRNEQQLQATWETRKSEVQDFNRTEFRLRELQREVNTNRELYDIFFTRMKTVSETGGFEKPHARLVDRALVPTAPIKPNKRLSVTLAFVLGVMLGCGVAILLDMLDNTIKRPEEVEEKLHAPLLGALPLQQHGKAGFFEHVWERPQSQYAESIRTLRTSIFLSSPDRPLKVLVVTSTVPGEGKSTTALNLASAMGQMENVLVIGADMRRPSLAGKCGLDPNHKGLSHYVSGVAELDECIERLDELGVSVMPAGVIPPNPLELISSRRFVDALEQLKQRFDRIILDSAPVMAVSDGLVLASYADSVVYLVKADATPATQAQRGVASVIGSNEPLAGVVLTQFDARKASRYYGSGHDPYGDYYQNRETG
ncbi:polysaccharide biosynthesis tyrosine autokinase [Seongchinamella unica]|uniref:non-specific protein-tyrosine kinase n=1 Tax=Seongchinamella unica TaxID=2547392 RepID=A0A4R5LR39_9GAMM|nr:polysaccharide biosynthesis tyrosine autokinase [Seongchinamella unica]TDG12896.1 polysaccharide biosynthesis tyrosine autokinase [Seongchinamella unica]